MVGCTEPPMLITNKQNSTNEYVKDFDVYKKEIKCAHCKCEFKNKHKVRDHDHITGYYRGAAHAS